MFGLILTLIKPFNSAFVLWFIINNNNWLAAIAIAWLMLCDIFDGYFFRRSPWGEDKKLLWFRRVFDVACDRVAIEAVLMIMIIYLQFPIYLYITEGVREIFLVSIWLYGYRTGKPLREPNLFSRLSTFSVGLMAIAWLTFPRIAAWCLIPIILFGIPGAKKYYQAVTKGF